MHPTFMNSNLYFTEKGKVLRNPSNKTLFSAIYIGTLAKGPLYTLVDGVGKRLNTEFKQALIRMNYMVEDTPINDDMFFETIVDSSNPYSFYPLIKQILGINDFIHLQGYEYNNIYLDRILITSKSGEQRILNGNKLDKKIRKACEKFELMTSVSKIVNDKPYILMHWDKGNNTFYSITDEIENYDKALVILPDIESGYLIYGYTLEALLSISNVFIELKYSKRIRKGKSESSKRCTLINDINLNFLDISRDGNSVEYIMEYSAVGLEQILKMCIYVPQLIMIERVLNDVDVDVTVSVESERRIASLTIKKEDYNPDICLIDIISRIISHVCN